MCGKSGLHYHRSRWQPGLGVMLQAVEEEWTEQETLLLLEGVEIYGEAWPRVAAHVGSKPSFKCAMRFLQVPPRVWYLPPLDDKSTCWSCPPSPCESTRARARAHTLKIISP